MLNEQTRSVSFNGTVVIECKQILGSASSDRDTVQSVSATPRFHWH